MIDFENSTQKEKTDFWITNLLVSQSVFSNMPDYNISENLNHWCDDIEDCGSPACFGGWIARIPYFQNLGIVSAFNGSPYFKFNFPAAHYLFGNKIIFDTRQDWEEGSDVEVILSRIESALSDLL